MKIRLNVINDLISPGPEGEPPVITKKNVITKYYVYPQDLLWTGEILDRKGRVYKGRCRVFCRELGEVVVRHTLEDMRKMSQGLRMEIKGFKRY